MVSEYRSKNFWSRLKLLKGLLRGSVLIGRRSRLLEIIAQLSPPARRNLAVLPLEAEVAPAVVAGKRQGPDDVAVGDIHLVDLRQIPIRVREALLDVQRDVSACLYCELAR